MKYGCPTLKGSKDIAQVKVLSTDNDNDAAAADEDADDAEGMALALWDYRPGELKSIAVVINASRMQQNFSRVV